MSEQEKKLAQIIGELIAERDMLKQEIEELTVYHNVTIEFYEKEIEHVSKPRRFKIKSKGA